MRLQFPLTSGLPTATVQRLALATLVAGAHVVALWALSSTDAIQQPAPPSATAPGIVPSVMSRLIPLPSTLPTPDAAMATPPKADRFARKSTQPSAAPPGPGLAADQPKPLAQFFSDSNSAAARPAHAPATNTEHGAGASTGTAQKTATSSSASAPMAAATNMPSTAPSSDAEYLNNPEPSYPPLSQKLGEQGIAVYQVRISTEGRPLRAQLIQSSGYDRLDAATEKTLMSWRYKPGTQNGVPVEMTYQTRMVWRLQRSSSAEATP